MTFKRTNVMGIDLGGQSFTVATDDEIYSVKRTFGSAPEALRHVFAKSGAPSHLTVAMAGFELDGGITLTNRPHWGRLRPIDFQIGGCTSASLIHDMRAKKLGLNHSDVVTIVDGKPAAGIEPVVLTFSSGVGQENVESGHTTWQPTSSVEDSILAFLRTQFPRQRLFSVEDLIGGKNIGNLYLGLVHHGFAATPSLHKDVVLNLEQGVDIGSLLTTGYKDGDPFCLEAGKVIGSIMGQYIRNVQVTTENGARGGIVITGGGMPRDFLLALVDDSEMLAVRTGGSQHNSWIGETPILLADDPYLGAKGAREHARTLIAA